MLEVVVLVVMKNGRPEEKAKVGGQRPKASIR
jgi:hypothetical protein